MTLSSVAIQAGEIERVALAALVCAGALKENAAPVARAIAMAEAEENSVCGLFYLPVFCEQLGCGKIDGRAEPTIVSSQAVISVDARHGFAHPAIEAGLPHLLKVAGAFGVATLGVSNSYNCLALSHHVKPIATAGCIGLCMSNAPAAVAPPGASRALFGTNPLAFAVPMPDGSMIVIDQSMSAVTKTEMRMRHERGETIPLGWAQDYAGAPTNDPGEGLRGALLPSGGQKGSNIALIVEIFAAALTGSRLSTQASSFGDNEGGPPGIGQFLLAIDPEHFGGKAFTARLVELAGAFEVAGVRLPGRASAEREWRQMEIVVDRDLWGRSLALCQA